MGIATFSQRTVFTPLLVVLIALAWLTLWVWGHSPYGRYLHHDALSPADLTSGLAILWIITGWTVMIIAMMLPTTMPLLGLFSRMTWQRTDRTLLLSLLITGYLSTWTLFGIVALGSDGVLHLAVEQSAWLDANAWIIGAGVLVVAGLYQFTPLKYYCLEKCRSPLNFILRYWQGRHDCWHAFRLGVRHGLFCIGCCWSLMLLMFVVGMGNLGWMLLLGAVMALEKNVPRGYWFSAPVGIILLCWGGLEAILALA
jgi:predicted metal-binding membrane protein